MLLNPNQPLQFVAMFAILFTAILFRYFVAAGIFYYIFYIRGKEKYKADKLGRKWRKNQIKKEITWSAKSSVIFALSGAVLYWLWFNDFTLIYLDINLYPVWYLPVSFLLVAFLHETYYYWTHRLMHNPNIFLKVHKVHHDSITPSPWTSFSFHHWESIIGSLILPLIFIFIPVNIYVLGIYLIFMSVSSVINHLDIEIYPDWFMNSRLGKWFIGATHHHYHHEEFNTNYGLYFTFWDRWMNTESRHTQ